MSLVNAVLAGAVQLGKNVELQLGGGHVLQQKADGPTTTPTQLGVGHWTGILEQKAECPAITLITHVQTIPNNQGSTKYLFSNILFFSLI